MDSSTPVCPKCGEPMQQMCKVYDTYWVNPAAPAPEPKDLKVFSEIFVCAPCGTAASTGE